MTLTGNKKYLTCIFADLHNFIIIGLISSDESDAEGAALAIRPLSWRTDDVSEYFQLLDERWKAGMTSQQKKANRKTEAWSSKWKDHKWSSTMFALGCAC